MCLEQYTLPRHAVPEHHVANTNCTVGRVCGQASRQSLYLCSIEIKSLTSPVTIVRDPKKLGGTIFLSGYRIHCALYVNNGCDDSLASPPDVSLHPFSHNESQIYGRI